MRAMLDLKRLLAALRDAAKELTTDADDAGLIPSILS